MVLSVIPCILRTPGWADDPPLRRNRTVTDGELPEDPEEQMRPAFQNLSDTLQGAEQRGVASCR
jgi:hypothetical protein